MDHTIMVTPHEIFNIIVVVAGAIVTISAAITAIAKAVGKAKEPNKVQEIGRASCRERV